MLDTALWHKNDRNGTSQKVCTAVAPSGLPFATKHAHMTQCFLWLTWVLINCMHTRKRETFWCLMIDSFLPCFHFHCFCTLKCLIKFHNYDNGPTQQELYNAKYMLLSAQVNTCTCKTCHACPNDLDSGYPDPNNKHFNPCWRA